MRDGVEERSARKRRLVGVIGVIGVIGAAVLIALLAYEVIEDDAPRHETTDARDAAATDNDFPGSPPRARGRRAAPRDAAEDAGSSPQTVEVPDRVLLSVRVRTEDGVALPVAHVALDGPDLSIQTKIRNPDGTIHEFHQTPRMPCELIVRHPQLLPHVQTLESLPDHPIDVVLRRGGSVTGRVVDGTGGGVAGARVLGLGPRTGGIWRDVGGIFAGDSLPDHVETTTRDDGSFTLTGLRDTTYFVTASKDGLVPSPLPAATRPQARRPGDHVEILLLPTYVIRARFVDAVTGSPVPVVRLFFGTTRTYEGAPGRAIRDGGSRAWRDGLTQGPPPVGTLLRHVQAHDAVDAPVWVAEVTSLFYETRTIRVPLRPVTSDEATVVELTPRGGPSGRLVVRLTDPAAAPLLGRYDLLVRPVDAQRWSLDTLEFDDDGAAEIDLPPGRYAWTGGLLRLLGLPTDGKFEIRANERTELPLDLPANRLARPRLRVVDVAGNPLRDLQWRIQGPGSSPADRRASGRVQGLRDPSQPDPELHCVLAGECVLHVFKSGYRPVAKPVVLPAGGRPVIEVVLEPAE